MNDIMNGIMKYCVNYVRNGSNIFLIFDRFFLIFDMVIRSGNPVRKPVRKSCGASLWNDQVWGA